jgi:hypothetical protein
MAIKEWLSGVSHYETSTTSQIIECGPHFQRVFFAPWMVNKLRRDTEKLEKYYQEVSRIILVRQHAASGLVSPF